MVFICTSPRFLVASLARPDCERQGTLSTEPQWRQLPDAELHEALETQLLGASDRFRLAPCSSHKIHRRERSRFRVRHRASRAADSQTPTIAGHI